MRKNYFEVVAAPATKEAVETRHEWSTFMNVTPKVTQAGDTAAFISASAAAKCLIYKGICKEG